MARDERLENIFGVRTRRPPVPSVADPDDTSDTLSALDTDETIAPEPLLAETPMQHEQWRGYVLVCVNANVEKVCESVKERLNGHFRGMSLVTGLYDLIVRVEADSKEEFKQTLILVRETPGVVQSVTLMDLN